MSAIDDQTWLTSKDDLQGLRDNAMIKKPNVLSDSPNEYVGLTYVKTLNEHYMT